ncbi:hypothetical protein [Asticcacaulis solisilvae]|uniref:hypothetical protein n=1 Tax=Asticcacaulis solisilvae TaxID=1217274 RepID=UPI003FD71B7E
MSEPSHTGDHASPAMTADPATLSVRFMLIQDQLRMAAEKVNLLAGMGLSHTDGYKTAFEAYEVKLGEFNTLRQMLGV